MPFATRLKAMTVQELLCFWYSHKGSPEADAAANELAQRLWDLPTLPHFPRS